MRSGGSFTGEDGAACVSDQDALARAGNGDQEALALLYDRHAAAMLRLAHRFMSDSEDAQDLVHDVFLEAWQRAGTYEMARGSVRAWLLLRVRSRALDRLRHARMRRATAHDVADYTSPQPAPVPSGEADGARARELLASLPAAQRQAIELSYFSGLTCREIAARCGVAEGTVKARISRAVARLRIALQAGSAADT